MDTATPVVSTARRDPSRRLLALAAALLLVVVACDGEATADSSPQPMGSPAMAESSRAPVSLAASDDDLCLHVVEVGQRLDALRAVELRLPNRVALEVELDKLQAAYTELENVDFGPSEERLAGSLKRLGYRLGELELAVEDFRTNSRPQRAAPHVEEDAENVADELAAFDILSRC
jgi:hypothetical protein